MVPDYLGVGCSGGVAFDRSIDIHYNMLNKGAGKID